MIINDWPKSGFKSLSATESEKPEQDSIRELSIHRRKIGGAGEPYLKAKNEAEILTTGIGRSPITFSSLITKANATSMEYEGLSFVDQIGVCERLSKIG